MRKILLFVFLTLAFISQGQTVTIDQTFNAGNTGPNGTIYDFLILPDGKIIIAGGFTAYNNVPRNRIARLNADGSLDTDFDPGTGANASIFTVALAPDGKIMVGGYFTAYNGSYREYVARINSDGTLDGTFFAFGFSQPQDLTVSVRKIVVQPDEKILIGGSFFMPGASGKNLYRLNNDGSKDVTFTPTSSDPVFSIVNFEDKTFVGLFTAYPGQQIRKVNPLGGFDSSFTAFDTKGSINNLYAQSDGKLIFAANMTAYEGGIMRRWPINRMNADGSVDSTFQRYFIEPESGWSQGLTIAAYNNKYLVGGIFQGLDNGTSSNIALFNVDGTVDDSLDFGTGFDESVIKIQALPNNQILAAGSFWTYNGEVKRSVVRLNALPLSSKEFSQKNNVIVHTAGSTVNYTSAMTINSIQIYDLSGRLLRNSNAINNTEASINVSATNQILVSRITLENGAVVINKTAI